MTSRRLGTVLPLKQGLFSNTPPEITALSGDPEMTLCVDYTDTSPTDFFPAMIYLYCFGGKEKIANTACVENIIKMLFFIFIFFFRVT